jgi:hypothetical protein
MSNKSEQKSPQEITIKGLNRVVSRKKIYDKSFIRLKRYIYEDLVSYAFYLVKGKELPNNGYVIAQAVKGADNKTILMYDGIEIESDAIGGLIRLM